MALCMAREFRDHRRKLHDSHSQVRDCTSDRSDTAARAATLERSDPRSMLLVFVSWGVGRSPAFAIPLLMQPFC